MKSNKRLEKLFGIKIRKKKLYNQKNIQNVKSKNKMIKAFRKNYSKQNKKISFRSDDLND